MSNLALQAVTSADQYPATVPPTTAPYRLGQYAAQLGEDYLTRAFVMRHDQREYLRGYQTAIAKANESKVIQ